MDVLDDTHMYCMDCGHEFNKKKSHGDKIRFMKFAGFTLLGGINTELSEPILMPVLLLRSIQSGK